MRAVGVIPARWASTRFPGKILADLCGKPLIQHVWERVRTCSRLSDLLIACDETHVAERCEAFGARTVMTRSDHPSGSDRIAEAVEKIACDIVVNIQGDEPLIEPALVDALVREAEQSGAPMVTAMTRIKKIEDLQDPNVVKVVCNTQGDALYFSRSPIPYRRDAGVEDPSGRFRHLGIYAYQKSFLLEYCRWPKSFLETEEKLEQLRVLEAGHRIRCVITGTEAIGVDTPEDLDRVARILKG